MIDIKEGDICIIASGMFIDTYALGRAAKPPSATTVMAAPWNGSGWNHNDLKRANLDQIIATVPEGADIEALRRYIAARRETMEDTIKTAKRRYREALINRAEVLRHQPAT